MRVPSFRQWVPALCVAAAGVAVVVRAQPPATANPATEAKPVTVAALERQLPLGHLGVPLGTVVRVTGEVLDGRATRRKGDEGKTLLRIVTVNGKKLPQSVDFEFGRAAATVKKPAPGDPFDYYAHEYGEFDGVVEPPKELGLESVKLAHDGFHYRPRLTVHASNGGRK